MEITDYSRESDGETQELVVTITASASEVNKVIDDVYKDLRKLEYSGFRKGKAPREVIERENGGRDMVYARIAEEIVNSGAPAALDDADVIFIGDTNFNLENLPAKDTPFTFTVSGPVPPEVKLSSYDEVSIDMPPAQATEEEIDVQIEELTSVYYNYDIIDDPNYEIEDGDFVTVRMTIMNDGAIIPGLADVERMIGIGGGSMPASFDEHLIGAKKGYTLDFDFEAVSEKERPELGDGKLHANVEIMEIRKRVVPELDEEFLAKFGASSLDDLRDQMRMTINMQKDRTFPELIEQRVVDALVERVNEDDVPQYYVDFMRENVSRELMQRLQKDGMGLQDFLLKNNVEAEKMQAEIEEEAIARAKRDMALEALFKEKGWEVTDEDIMTELRGVDDPEGTIAELKEAHRMADLRKMCRQSMAARWLAKTADITVVE